MEASQLASGAATGDSFVHGSVKKLTGVHQILGEKNSLLLMKL